MSFRPNARLVHRHATTVLALGAALVATPAARRGSAPARKEKAIKGANFNAFSKKKHGPWSGSW